MNAYEELRKVVVDNGGIYRMTMGALRNIEQAGRLGKIVRDRIHTNLQHHQLGHLPVELPNDQTDLVRIYDTQSQLGSIVSAVLEPSESGDRRLRELSGTNAAKKLSDLRVLLDEAIEIIEA